MNLPAQCKLRSATGHNLPKIVIKRQEMALEVSFSVVYYVN